MTQREESPRNEDLDEWPPIRPVTQAVYRCFLSGESPSPAVLQDFGITSSEHFAALKHAVFDQTPITHSAYYFAEWPAVHKAYSDMAIAALSGKREDIAKVLADNVDKIHRAATGN